MEHVVTGEEHGLKLRSLLRGVMGVSYSAMKSAKWDNRILVNGSPCPVDRIVQTGDHVIFLPKESVSAYPLIPYPVPLSIIYQDEWMLVIDKPAPLASQSSQRHPNDSLENALYAHMGCPVNFIYRPVNRLDKGTSGLMTIALDAHAQHLLQKQLHSPIFKRIYLAVLDGIPPHEKGTVSASIAKVEEASVKRIISEHGKPSVTHYEVLRTANGRALVRLELETGRTHQIRVHMSHLGCPVFGDFLYGTESDLLPGRFALHSSEIVLTHPISGEELHLISPLPPQLQKLMDESA